MHKSAKITKTALLLHGLNAALSGSWRGGLGVASDSNPSRWPTYLFLSCASVWNAWLIFSLLILLMFYVRCELLLALSLVCPVKFCWGGFAVDDGWEGRVAVTSVLMWVLNYVTHMWWVRICSFPWTCCWIGPQLCSKVVPLFPTEIIGCTLGDFWQGSCFCECPKCL